MERANRPVRNAAQSRARRADPATHRPGHLVEHRGQPPRIPARSLPDRGNPEAHPMKFNPSCVTDFSLSRASARRQSGMTLLEVLIAVTLFGFLSVGILM